MSLRHLRRILCCIQTALCLLLFLTLGTAAWAEPAFKVGFVAPTVKGDPFFTEVIKAMQAAARDLNIDLAIEYAGRSMPLYAKRNGIKLMEAYKPDYFITGNWPGGAKYHLQEAQDLGIKTFVINTPMTENGDSTVGAPRNKLSNWLGQMSPDNFQASYQLADILIAEAQSRKLAAADGKVHIIALNGNADEAVSEQRLAGLNARVKGYQDVVLKEAVLAGWQKETAYRETLRMLEQFPSISVIWSASDLMAEGATEAAEKAGRKPGQDIVIGGFDWNEENLRDIEQGRLTASMGGHLLEGAWALVLLYDYHKGIDFARELDVNFESSMYAITTQNVEQYSRLIDGMDWDKVDFTQFSKALTDGNSAVAITHSE
jgi:ABC-type sugar transport system substrate-binding protein